MLASFPPMKTAHFLRTLLALPILAGGITSLRADDAKPLAARLKAEPLAIIHEAYVDGNWELIVANADGSSPINLTNTPKVNEHYPQVSPDGKMICFSVDDGEGRDAVRSLWVMDRDGENRKKLAENAREPFWSPDSKRIGFLPQEYPKFNVIDYYTKGMNFCDLATGTVMPHPNSDKLHHLYNPGFSPNGKWIVATVHAGMGVDHAILLIEANGAKIINLNIPGCRPCLSGDGKQIAWGSGDHEIDVAPLDTDADEPAVGKWRLQIQDKTNETYHVDWSPDSRYLAFSRGPASKGDPNKKGTFQAACEIVGVYAPGWNIFAVSAEKSGILNLNTATEADVVQITNDGASNKEPDWMPRKPASR